MQWHKWCLHTDACPRTAVDAVDARPPSLACKYYCIYCIYPTPPPADQFVGEGGYYRPVVAGMNDTVTNLLSKRERKQLRVVLDRSLACDAREMDVQCNAAAAPARHLVLVHQ